jgi:hypothetical protein
VAVRRSTDDHYIWRGAGEHVLEVLEYRDAEPLLRASPSLRIDIVPANDARRGDAGKSGQVQRVTSVAETDDGDTEGRHAMRVVRRVLRATATI